MAFWDFNWALDESGHGKGLEEGLQSQYFDFHVFSKS